MPPYPKQDDYSLHSESGSSSKSDDDVDLELAKSEDKLDAPLVESKVRRPSSPKPYLSVSNVKAISACFLYSFCSVSMMLTNKSLASSYTHLIQGDLNILLVVFQAITAVICVEGCRYVGLVDYPPLTWNTVKSWAPVNMFFCLMLFTGMASLEHNSVPMVTVFKNIANVGTTAGDFFFFGSRPEFLVLVALAVMLLGAVAAAAKDVTFSVVGLVWMVANAASTSAYVLYMRYATTKKDSAKLSKFGMVYVNNLLAIFFLLPAAWMSGEVDTFLSSGALHTWEYAGKNFFAGFVGFFLNFASLNCVQVTGATTYAIVGSLNKIPVALLGWAVFQDAITTQTWLFIAVGMSGGFLYSYAKLQSSRQNQKS